jgi:hypothetical protein
MNVLIVGFSFRPGPAGHTTFIDRHGAGSKSFFFLEDRGISINWAGPLDAMDAFADVGCFRFIFDLPLRPQRAFM